MTVARASATRADVRRLERQLVAARRRVKDAERAAEADRKAREDARIAERFEVARAAEEDRIVVLLAPLLAPGVAVSIEGPDCTIRLTSPTGAVVIFTPIGDDHTFLDITFVEPQP